MPVTRTTIESATETSTHQSAGVAVGTITGDYTIKLFVSALTPATGTARIAIEEATSSGFSTPEQLAVFNFQGTLPPEGVVVSFRKREGAGTDLFGTAGAYARVNLQELNGSSPSITYNAWIES